MASGRRAAERSATGGCGTDDSPLVRVIDPLTVQVTVPVLAEVGPQAPITTTSTTAPTTTDTTTQRKPE